MDIDGVCPIRCFYVFRYSNFSIESILCIIYFLLATLTYTKIHQGLQSTKDYNLGAKYMLIRLKTALLCYILWQGNTTVPSRPKYSATKVIEVLHFGAEFRMALRGMFLLPVFLKFISWFVFCFWCWSFLDPSQQPVLEYRMRSYSAESAL